jgi:hypothetical protein
MRAANIEGGTFRLQKQGHAVTLRPQCSLPRSRAGISSGQERVRLCRVSVHRLRRCSAAHCTCRCDAARLATLHTRTLFPLCRRAIAEDRNCAKERLFGAEHRRVAASALKTGMRQESTISVRMTRRSVIPRPRSRFAVDSRPGGQE